jgi:23S rRNA G2445 N2-methylase RlmL
MVDESLVQYIYTKTKVDINKLDALVSYDEADDLEYPISEDEADLVISSLGELQILDPACGSGAFPMGVLQKVVYILQKLDPGAKKWLDAKIDLIQDESFKDRIRNDYENKGLDYIRKSFVIKDSIYGVDIQPIAVEVAKLRCFLTLIIDENINDDAKNRGIDTLPNLDFKFVAANTLIHPPTISSGLNLDHEFETSLEQATEQYFQPLSPQAKFDAWKKIDELIEGKADEEYKQAFSMQAKDYFQDDKFNKALAAKNTKKASASLNRGDLWKSYKNVLRHKSVGFFETKYFFPAVKDGFDIVIGNPPYIQLQKNSGELANLYQDEGYKVFIRTGDIYCLFYERGLELLRPSTGVLCYITSNKWMRAAYGEKTRSMLLQKQPLKLIDFGGFKVFESATVDTSILLIQNITNFSTLHATHFKNDYKQSDSISDYFDSNEVAMQELGLGPWFIGDSNEQSLKIKIERVGVPLGEWGVNIYRGVLTGCNEAFIIDQNTRNQLINEEAKSADIIKPLVRGKDISKYTMDFQNLYILATGYDTDIPGQYPAVYRYIRAIAEQIESGALKVKGKGVYKRDDQGVSWWNLRACSYYKDFEHEKIMYSEIVQSPQFYLDEEGKYFAEATSFILTGPGLDVLTGVLNSRAATYFFKRWYAGGGLGGSGLRYKKAFLEDLPVPKENKANSTIYTKIAATVRTYTRLLREGGATSESTEATIDRLVYELYNLTPEEIQMIESST